ncbi:hypothetical protein SMACR_03305 [Sordaria macrospora]|uniref:WGS project CABT00000000 data, contig 2.10 n=2 Tax=Sordaria macrospora TaxID=5147 RepID=F7VWI1_SORMK|nr:uncharacterized protein SMAC_03305 [Sordaria macrospora k-hell]KAA8635630.1 hypothetical protein SMACR_03305 [Sordaria macrospora]KAH7630053.1 hypothetical protein B0T09DRAFT_141219 [Sordaria sp. MPI-SDFR-AT-0083]WPJ66734.1 hypothetical protein SMAC4_03305 [Sordaria macrospora]CCC09749.1 unnamed protein product [Sordaria macrospora k-hell]
MGNANTKESRGDDSGRRGLHSALADAGAGSSTQSGRESSRRNRNTRHDLTGLLGRAAGGSSSHADERHERKETKQEREARRLEKERVARLQERERSMKEEHVDGGYLVTMGTYVGPEDFNKQIVRQLMIERKLAPFWRGLNDVDGDWTESQIIAAARGLPIPAAGETPSDELIPRPRSPASPTDANSNINHLTVPMDGRSLSTTSEHSASNPGSALPSPGSGKGSSSPFKPTRGKAIAAVLGGGSSRNASSTEIVPREIMLPNDPFVNGQPLEVFLYKNATECPICFLTYPPYLNHTRCCDQPICSECFVQIKRPDPHFPEGHNENDPNNNPEESAGLLVSEPACCPYCTQPDFGVTYEPPPFRRGLTYGISPLALGSTSAAMSSESSVNSGSLSPGVTLPGGRRRNQSISANAPNVVLTDRVRPEWANKLQAARAHLARRAAAATALHTAAFMMNNNESRALRSRFGRRNTGGSGSASATPGNGDENRGTSPAAPATAGTTTNTDRAAGPGGNGNRRSRLEDLEEMMFAEAIRLSLAAEEERKKKAEKEEQKEAKKREKEREKAEKKAEKAAAKAAAKQGGPYEATRSGHSSASGSSLSLPGLSFGRKRGNSAASNLRVEASVASAMASTGAAMSSTAAPGALGPDSNTKDKGKGVDRSAGAANDASAPSRPNPSPQPTPGPSHLRQMSSASSVSSSAAESNQGSYVPPSNLQDPHASGLSLGGRCAVSEDGDEQDRDPSTSTEPLFNFRSLAEVVDVSIEGEHAGKRLSQINADGQATEGQDDSKKSGEGAGEHVEHVFESQTTGLSEQDSEMHSQPPRFTITLDSPATSVEDVGTTSDSKHVGNETTVEHARQVTQ